MPLPPGDRFLDWADRRRPGYSIEDFCDEDIADFLAASPEFRVATPTEFASLKIKIVQTLLSFIDVEDKPRG